MNKFCLVMLLFVIAACKSDTNTYNKVVESQKEIEKKDVAPVMDKTVAAPIDVTETKEKEIVKEPKVEEPKPKPAPVKVKPKPKKKAKPKAVITFDNAVHSFGTITEGDKIKHKFTFTNTGKGILTVKNATATCGCTMPGYPFIPIKPGETGYIDVTYNSVGKSGEQTPTITVFSNAVEREMKLQLTGNVVPKSEE